MGGRGLRLAALTLVIALIVPVGHAHAAAGDRGRRQTGEREGLFEDIPIPGLLISLGIAALIGAAGGLIYAGIMGPKR